MTTVPFMDLHGIYQTQREEIRAAIDGVLEDQTFILGPEVRAFEEELAAFIGAGVTAVGCASGTDALLLSLLALDIGPGDEVIVPAYSFFATASCVARVGATAVWVDVESSTFNLDPAQVARKTTSRTKAIIAVHLFGRCASVDQLPQGPVLIEDAAQALGAEIDGYRACTVGDLGCLSFFPSKNLGGFGDGGMVVCRSPETAARVESLRRHGARRKYHHEEVGLNSRLDSLQAAILRVRLKELNRWIRARRRNAARYRALFAATGLDDEVVLPASDEGGRFRHTYNQFVLRVHRRDELRSFLTANGIGSAVYYPRPLHLQDCFSMWGGAVGDCPVAEGLCKEALAIPIFPGLTDEQQVYVVDKITAFYQGLP